MSKAIKKQRSDMKVHVTGNLNLAILKEGRMYVAYAPALDLVAQGKSMNDARKNFDEVFSIYIEETLRNGTLEKDLQRCGWQKRAGNMEPPTMSTMPISEKLGKDLELTALTILPLNQNMLCPA